MLKKACLKVDHEFQVTRGRRGKKKMGGKSMEKRWSTSRATLKREVVEDLRRKIARGFPGESRRAGLNSKGSEKTRESKTSLNPKAAATSPIGEGERRGGEHKLSRYSGN